MPGPLPDRFPERFPDPAKSKIMIERFKEALGHKIKCLEGDDLNYGLSIEKCLDFDNGIVWEWTLSDQDRAFIVYALQHLQETLNQ